jgi:hypothetical protein
MSRTVHLYRKSKYEKHEIDAVEYAKRYGEHMIAVRIQNWRSKLANGERANPDLFIGDLTELVHNNQDTLINTRVE